jgi:hypothetical protein
MYAAKVAWEIFLLSVKCKRKAGNYTLPAFLYITLIISNYRWLQLQPLPTTSPYAHVHAMRGSVSYAHSAPGNDNAANGLRHNCL